MRLYYFNPNTYSTTFTIMANSRDEAIATVQAWVDKLPGPQEKSNWSEREFYQDKLDLFKRGFKDPYDKKGYVIEEYGPNEVILGEIS